jgi:Ca2+/Na+ antiporter
MTPKPKDNTTDEITRDENPKELSDYALFMQDMRSFVLENTILRYVALIFLGGGLVYVVISFFKLTFLSIVAYVLGIVLFLFLIVYAYREWNKKRMRYVDLEKKLDMELDTLIEDEEFQKEITGSKNERKNRRDAKES